MQADDSSMDVEDLSPRRGTKAKRKSSGSRAGRAGRPPGPVQQFFERLDKANTTHWRVQCRAEAADGERCQTILLSKPDTLLRHLRVCSVLSEAARSAALRKARGEAAAEPLQPGEEEEVGNRAFSSAAEDVREAAAAPQGHSPGAGKSPRKRRKSSIKGTPVAAAGDGGRKPRGRPPGPVQQFFERLDKANTNHWRVQCRAVNAAGERCPEVLLGKPSLLLRHLEVCPVLSAAARRSVLRVARGEDGKVEPLQPYEEEEEEEEEEELGSLDFISEEDLREVNELLARAFLSAGIDASFVENQYFREAIKLLRPAYELPTQAEMMALLGALQLGQANGT